MSKEYHQQHPTISFRCRNIEEYERIKNMVKHSGKSETTFIREILLGAEVKESQSFNQGYNQGFNVISVPCPLCKEDMIFNFNDDPDAYPKVMKALKNYFHTPFIENKEKQDEVERKKKFENTYYNSNY